MGGGTWGDGGKGKKGKVKGKRKEKKGSNPFLIIRSGGGGGGGNYSRHFLCWGGGGWLISGQHYIYLFTFTFTYACTCVARRPRLLRASTNSLWGLAHRAGCRNHPHHSPAAQRFLPQSRLCYLGGKRSAQTCLAYFGERISTYSISWSHSSFSLTFIGYGVHFADYILGATQKNPCQGVGVCGCMRAQSYVATSLVNFHPSWRRSSQSWCFCKTATLACLGMFCTKTSMTM